MTLTPLQEALAPASDQLNADDLIPGPRTIKITGARITEDKRQKRVTLNYDGDNGRPFKPCKTMARAMTLVWSITDEAQFVGKSITVYRDPEVAFGDQGKIGGIRISHMSHIDSPKTVKLTVAQGRKANFVFQPLTAEVRELPGSKSDAATNWANGFKNQVAQAVDLATLENFVSSKSAKLDELKSKRPELHAECENALAERRQFFAAGSEFSDDDNPFAVGAPKDFTGFIAGIKNRIANANDTEALDQAEADFNDLKDQLPDGERAEIDGLLTAKRKALSGGESAK